MPTLKQCTMCGEKKSLDQFHRRKTGKHGRTPRCKPCASIRHREYYQRKREERIAYAKRWNKNNRDRNNEARRRRYHKALREKIETMRKGIKR